MLGRKLDSSTRKRAFDLMRLGLASDDDKDYLLRHFDGWHSAKKHAWMTVGEIQKQTTNTFFSVSKL